MPKKQKVNDPAPSRKTHHTRKLKKNIRSVAKRRMAFLDLVCRYIRACRKPRLVCISFCCCYLCVRNHEGDPSFGSPISYTVTADQLWWRRRIVQSPTKIRSVSPGNKKIPAFKGRPVTAPAWRKQFRRRRKLISGNINDSIINLGDNQKFGKFNDGAKYILMSVKCFLRHACAIRVVPEKPSKNFTQVRPKSWKWRVRLQEFEVITAKNSRSK